MARIWRQEGLKVSQKQAPSGMLWGYEGSCMRLRASYLNHVWIYDFVFVHDAFSGKIRLLSMIDEYTRQCLTIHCSRRIGAIQVIEQLSDVMSSNGIPECIRSDNRLEFVAKELRK